MKHVLAAGVALLCACITATHSVNATNTNNVVVVGKVKLGKRESAVYEYTISKATISLAQTHCLTAVFNTKKVRGVIEKIPNGTYEMHGLIVDYIREASQDPISYTISPVINSCGNKYVFRIYRAMPIHR